MILKKKKKLKTVSKKHKFKIKEKLKFEKFDPLMLLEQFSCIIGPQRSGKTSLARALMNTLYTKYNKSFIRESQEHVQELNSMGHKLKLDQPHLFYSNHECYLDKKNKCHGLEFDDMILPREGFIGQHFPYRSFLEMQEIDQDCDNRQWSHFDLGHKDFAKYYGHNGLTILSDCQDYSNCDKKLRGLFTTLILVVNRQRTKHWWQIKPRYTWYFYLKNNQIAEALKEFSSFVKVEVPIVQAYKFTYKGEIHKMYQSRSNESLFLNHLKNYKFRKPRVVEMSPEGVSKFCEHYEKIYVKKESEQKKKKSSTSED